MTKKLTKRVQRISEKIRYVLFGSSNRPTVYFTQSDGLEDMYAAANQGIQEEVERKREAFHAKQALERQKAQNNILKTKETTRLELIAAKKHGSEILRRLRNASRGGGASNVIYASIIETWRTELEDVNDNIKKLTEALKSE